jgi:hypothetical protein
VSRFCFSIISSGEKGRTVLEHFLVVSSLAFRFFFLIDIVEGGVQLGPLGTATTNRRIVLAPGDYDDGEIGGMIGRGNRSTRRKPAPVQLCPPLTPHAAWTRIRAAALGSQRLTSRPSGS